MIARMNIRKGARLLAIAIGLASPVLVHAGLLDKWLHEGEQPTRARFDLEPELVFEAGALEIDLTGRWHLGGSSLTFTEESEIRMDGRELDADDLSLGREARASGHRLADGTLAVRRLTLRSERGQVTELGALEAGRQPVGELESGAPN